MGNYSTRKIFIAILLIANFPNNSIQQRNINPDIQKKIDDFVKEIYLPASQISGLGLAIVQNDGELLYTTGYGMADKEKNILIGNNTQFLIGSVTKSFTSVVAIKLLNERFPSLGEAVLDTPIHKLLPEFNFTLNDRFRSERVTTRDLLAHRLCLSREDLQLLSDPFNSSEEVVYRTRYNPEICSIRGEFQYNNQMYVVAGQLIGHLANKSYAEAVNDVLNELGMNDSEFSSKTDDYSALPNRARPYYVMDNETFPVNTDLVKRVTLYNAAGGLFVPPNDMIKYMRFQLNEGNLDGKQIVPSDVMKWVFKPSTLVPSFGFKKEDTDRVLNIFGYGLGWMLSAYNGWEMNQHGGHFPTYLSQVSLFPAKKLAIYSSTNMSPPMVSELVLHAFIFETLMNSKNASEKAFEVKTQLDAQTLEKIPEEEAKTKLFMEKQRENALTGTQASIVGSFGSGSAGNVDISERFNELTNRTELFMEHGRWYKGWLCQEDKEISIYKINFTTDVIHDTYAAGQKEGVDYIAFDNNNTIIFFQAIFEQVIVNGKFVRGVSLDELPTIPWDPNSCGPETK